MQPAYAQWIPTIPQAGAYAVYVSYVSLRGCPVYCTPQRRHRCVPVNQQWEEAPGFIWVPSFDEGRNMEGRVTLTNESREINAVVTADAVKFGGVQRQHWPVCARYCCIGLYGNIVLPPVTSQYPVLRKAPDTGCMGRLCRLGIPTTKEKTTTTTIFRQEEGGERFAEVRKYPQTPVCTYP